jgi:hypothetical protein
MDPFPNCFSICESASSTALARSSAIAMRNAPQIMLAWRGLLGTTENTRRLELNFDWIVAG